MPGRGIHCLIKQHTMKTYWGSGGVAPRIVNLGIKRGEWSASRPSHFIPQHMS